MSSTTATSTATHRETRATRRQRSSLWSSLRKRPDQREALRQEQTRLQKQAQRLRHHRLWLQLQADLDRVLRGSPSRASKEG